MIQSSQYLSQRAVEKPEGYIWESKTHPTFERMKGAQVNRLGIVFLGCNASGQIRKGEGAVKLF